MRFLLTGKCICNAPFNKDTQMNDIVLNESNELTFKCNICKAMFKISTLWIKHNEKKTIAQEIDGKNSSNAQPKGRVYFDPKTLIHTFEDGSQAKLITRFEDCPPYINKTSTITSTKKEIRIWKALV